MFKKLFLAVLPAIMVLSSCGAAPKADKNDFFSKEDTLAHEEVFGEPAPLIKENVERKPEGIDEFVEADRPSLGIQTAVYQGKDSIRFVAAINISAGDFDSTIPVWTRTIYNADGSVKKSSTPFEAKKVYTSLKNGENTITIQQFNSANGTHYDYFSVYTILNINSGNEACFINAYVTVGSLKSKVLSTNVGGTKRLTFENTQTGYFLSGTINETPNSVRAQDAVTSSGDKARFTVPLAANDSFFVACNDVANSKFFVLDYNSLENGGAHDSFANDNLKLKANVSRVFVLYLNSSGGIWSDIAPDLYINDVKTAYSNIRTDGTDKVKCTLEGLNAGDVVKFKTGNDYLHFYHTDGSDLDDGDSYIILSDGDYTFFVTSDNRVFYTPVYYKAELTFDFTALNGWGGVSDFRIHAWNENGSIGTWDQPDENIVNNSYTLLSLGKKITHFIVYFHQNGAIKQSCTIDYGFAHGHSYKITVDPNPDDWSGNTFNSTVSVVDITA